MDEMRNYVAYSTSDQRMCYGIILFSGQFMVNHLLYFTPFTKLQWRQCQCKDLLRSSYGLFHLVCNYWLYGCLPEDELKWKKTNFMSTSWNSMVLNQSCLFSNESLFYCILQECITHVSLLTDHLPVWLCSHCLHNICGLCDGSSFHICSVYK